MAGNTWAASIRDVNYNNSLTRGSVGERGGDDADGVDTAEDQREEHHSGQVWVQGHHHQEATQSRQLLLLVKSPYQLKTRRERLESALYLTLKNPLGCLKVQFDAKDV